jgi:hypothetical protein
VVGLRRKTHRHGMDFQVADAVDAYDANLVGNLVNHPVVTYPDASVVLASRQFAATGRARDCCQRSNRRNDAVVNVGGEP